MVLIGLLSLWVSSGVGQSSLKYVKEKLNKTKQRLFGHYNIGKIFRAVFHMQLWLMILIVLLFWGCFFPWHQEWDDN